MIVGKCVNYYTNKYFNKNSPRYLIKEEIVTRRGRCAMDSFDNSYWYILTEGGWIEINTVGAEMVLISKDIAEKIIMILELKK